MSQERLTLDYGMDEHDPNFSHLEKMRAIYSKDR